MTTTGTTSRPETTIAPPARVFDPLAGNTNGADSASNKAPGRTPGGEDTPPPARPLPMVGLDRILSYVRDPRDEIWKGGALTVGLPTGLIGAPGVGKSRLALQASLCSIIGKPFLGWPTNGMGRTWAFLQTENNLDRLNYDLSRMVSGLTETDRQRVREHLHILNVLEVDFATVCMTDGSPDRPRIIATLEALQPDIVVIDPLRDAGRGDPNKDGDMIETCQAINSVIRHGNARRTSFVIHHGRTGAAEASKVFGDDAASFGRNSKVLNGWLRSQINVAMAGVEWPGVVIVGCGKNSNGPRWQPFAARLDESTMTYERLEPEDFDLDEWANQMGSTRKTRGTVTTEKTVEEFMSLVPTGKRIDKNDENDGLLALAVKVKGFTGKGALKMYKQLVGDGKLFESKKPRPEQKTNDATMVSRMDRSSEEWAEIERRAHP